MRHSPRGWAFSTTLFVFHSSFPVSASTAIVCASSVLKTIFPSAKTAPRLTTSQQATPCAIVGASVRVVARRVDFAIVASMKVRDSGMPEQDYWETLFVIDTVLDGLGIDSRIKDAVELGCGYGTFTLPVARRITGTLRAFDIEPAMLAATCARLDAASGRNVVLHERDVASSGFGLPAASADAVLLLSLLKVSASLLTETGRVLVIHWRSDIPTPRGPDLSIRPRPEQIVAWGREAGLAPAGPSQLLPPWHFGLTLRREES